MASLADLLSEGITPQERGLYERHLSNLFGPGGVDNPDGSRSSLYQRSFDIDGKTYNVPSVYNGKILPPRESIDAAIAQGLDNFPSYPDQATADRRYGQLHDFMERDTASYLAQRRPPQADVNGPIDPAAVLHYLAATTQNYPKFGGKGGIPVNADAFASAVEGWRPSLNIEDRRGINRRR